MNDDENIIINSRYIYAVVDGSTLIQRETIEKKCYCLRYIYVCTYLPSNIFFY